MKHTTGIHSPSSPDGKQIFPSFNPNFPHLHKVLYHKPRKKRTKYPTNSPSSTKPKKPDPDAPKITRPCTECGKTFWSWKALFGHMRCHPERQWRGINPPPELRRPEEVITEEDHFIATCLLMLANGPTVLDTYPHGFSDDCESNCRFECSSCKKVFGSHQALGGHRASHKNIKGCFAINRNDHDHEVEGWGYCINMVNLGGANGEDLTVDDHSQKMVMGFGHKCSICSRVFSSGQALGGHKRCHWDKGDDEPPSSLSTQTGPGPGPGPGSVSGPGLDFGLDLNLPANKNIEGDYSYTSSPGLTLDLSLSL